MNAQASLSSSRIERVAEELLSVDTADMRFLAVYFEEEFPLYELRYTFAYSFGRPRTFAEDDAVVGITHKLKSAPFKFTVEFRQHYVAQYGTERLAPQTSPIKNINFQSYTPLIYSRQSG